MPVFNFPVNKTARNKIFKNEILENLEYNPVKQSEDSIYFQTVTSESVSVYWSYFQCSQG